MAADQKGRKGGEKEREGRRRRKDPKYLFAFIGFWHEMGGGREGSSEVGLTGDGR